MSEVFIVDGLRTPIGKTNGILKDFLPEQLAAAVLNGLLARNSIKAEAIDCVFLGNATGPGGNLARVSVLEAGWPFTVPALTIDAQCGSGLASLNIASAHIAAGQAELVIAGGTESSSLAPKRRFNEKDPRFAGSEVFYDQAPFSPAWVGNPDIGEAAENLAQMFGITRGQMDEQALNSHLQACRAIADGRLAGIIKPLKHKGLLAEQDECPKINMSMKLLARLPGAFVDGGSITAGNSCLKHDGAAAVLLASAGAVQRYGLQPRAKISLGVNEGCDPNLFPLGPVGAIEKLLQDSKLELKDVDALEINEAFAVKILACCRQLDIAPSFVNRLGGAIAYGHPYGASGAIIMLHLLQTLEAVNGRFGIASIGAVGGMGTAILVERL